MVVKKRNFHLFLAISFLFSTLWALPLFARGDAEKIDQRPKLYASILPARFLVEQIAGDRFQAETVVLPGSSPATYEPTPRQMGEITDSAVLFRIGVPFEHGFIPRIEQNAPDLRIIDLRKGIELRTMEVPHSHHDDDHDDDDHDNDHESGSPDPHVWMNPRNMIVMADTILETLTSLDPEGESQFQAGHAKLVQELENVDALLEEKLSPWRGKRFFVYHPAFGYFAERYGLKQVPLEIEGKEPTPRQLTHYIEEAKEHGITIIFVQPEFPKESASTVAAQIKGSVVPISALDANYLDNLKSIAQALEGGLR